MSLFFTVMAHMDAGAGLVTTDVDRFRLFRTAGFCHDILRKINEDRTRTARAGDIESFFDDAAQVFPLPYGDTVFDDTPGDAHDINLLEGVVSDEVPGHLSGEAYERHAVIIGSSEACHRVSGSPDRRRLFPWSGHRHLPRGQAPVRGGEG